VLNTLEAVPVLRENTVRVYCTYKVANIDLKSHLRISGIQSSCTSSAEYPSYLSKTSVKYRP
jgi:hypothetical protein